MKPGRRAVATVVLAALAFTPPASAAPRAETFAAAAARAQRVLLSRWYDDGRWRLCARPGCPRTNRDWGADALTGALLLRYRTTRDPALRPVIAALLRTAPRYGAPCRALPCTQWSDVPLWDAVAALDERAALGGDARALATARADDAVVERAAVYARGACPAILYQQPLGGTNHLKTLETDADAIRAALLLARATGSRSALATAVARYAAAQHFYRDPVLALYSVYVVDDTHRCRQLPHRFFASVNGLMILDGLGLFEATRRPRYLHDAIATARAVDRDLADARGVDADLQAENDVGVPLVAAMVRLALRYRVAFARAWILRNAQAALGARTVDGFGRFFDGPPPPGTITAWQTAGGFALIFAAAALAPDAVPVPPSWRAARRGAVEIARLPATIRFTGSGIALLGTLGERCCEAGHARVVIDGRETVDRTGIWQNKSSLGISLPHTILFAWRWPRTAAHVVRIEAATTNPKEGGAFVHVRGIVVLGAEGRAR